MSPKSANNRIFVRIILIFFVLLVSMVLSSCKNSTSDLTTNQQETTYSTQQYPLTAGLTISESNIYTSEPIISKTITTSSGEETVKTDLNESTAPKTTEKIITSIIPITENATSQTITSIIITTTNPMTSTPTCNHIIVIDEGVSPTCEGSGLTEGKHCKVCGEVIIKQTVIPPAGHKEIIIEGTPASCTIDGLSSHIECKVCGKQLSEPIVTLAHGHSFIGKTCSICGYTVNDSIGLSFLFYRSSDYTYSILTGFGSCKDKNLVIPEKDSENNIVDMIEWRVTSFDESNMLHNKLKKLESVFFPRTMKIIEEHSFKECRNLKFIYLNEGLETIGQSAFFGCTSLRNFTLPSSLKEIGQAAFDGCFEITEINVPGSVTHIPDQCFDWCKNLSSVVFNEGTKTIGRDAFYHCEKLSSVILPRSITAIAEFAFEYCYNLHEITYLGTIEEWEDVGLGYGWAWGSGDVTIKCLDGEIVEQIIVGG